MRTIRVKQVLRVAPVIEGREEREGAEHLRTRKEINRKESGKEYARSCFCEYMDTKKHIIQ